MGSPVVRRYRIPKRLVGTVGRYGDRVPSRLSPIFLDREELESASSLPTRIKAALEDSLALIVVCSPQAVESKWVDQEIRVFKSAGREERVFAGIVNGDRAGYETVRDSKPCFPEALRYEIDSGASTDRCARGAFGWPTPVIVAMSTSRVS